MSKPKQSGIRNYKEVISEVRNLEDAAHAVLSRTLADVRNHGPNWIAKGVSARYAVKRKDLPRLGDIGVYSTGRHSLQIKYTGRPLTLARFGMSPKIPKPNRGGYTLKATVYKGSPQTIGKIRKLTKKQWANIGKNFQRQGIRNSPQSPWMLQPTGNKKEGGINYIPFQRRVQPGKFSHVMRTVSLPQMVTQKKDGPLHPEIENEFVEKLAERLAYHSGLLGK